MNLHPNKKQFAGQYVFFHTVYLLTHLIIWSYFTILLLRTTENAIDAVPLVVQYHGFHFTGLLAGFWISGRIFSWLGYLGTYRISNIIHAATTLLALLTLSRITDVYLIIALLGGIAGGLYWNATHIYNTGEIHGQERAKWVSVIYSLDNLLGVALPILIGGIISGYGYNIVFAVGFVVYLGAIFYPWKINKIPKDELRTSDFKSLSKRKGFKKWAAMMIFEGLTATARTQVLAVLPFLFIGSEFGVGALGSAVGLVGVIIAYLYRNDSSKKKLQHGYVGSIVILFSTIGLILFWSLPALVLRNLALKLGLSLYTPTNEEIQYRLREMVIGDFKNEYSIEVQQYREFFLYVGRVIIIGFMLIVFLAGVDIELVLMIMLTFSLTHEVGMMYIGSKLTKELGITGTRKPSLGKLPPISEELDLKVLV